MKTIGSGAEIIKTPLSAKIKADFRLNKSLYWLILPVLAFYIIFAYKPMYGAIIAFKDFSPRRGIIGSNWVGFKYFEQFFFSPNFLRVFGNTLKISLSSILFAFPAPIILALLINELKNKYFSRVIQTISYLPYFISLVVICSLIKEFTFEKGLINDFLAFFGINRTTMLNNPNLFVPVYIISDIWQSVGWGSIIYLAALTGISQELYEAAKIDGAGKWRQLLNVTLPGILPTIIVMLVLRVGNIMNVGFEKIILLYSPLTYETSDVISSFVYRKGIEDLNYSYSAAVGLFNSVINCVMLFSSNYMIKKLGGDALW